MATPRRRDGTGDLDDERDGDYGGRENPAPLASNAEQQPSETHDTDRGDKVQRRKDRQDVSIELLRAERHAHEVEDSEQPEHCHRQAQPRRDYRA